MQEFNPGCYKQAQIINSIDYINLATASVQSLERYSTLTVQYHRPELYTDHFLGGRFMCEAFSNIPHQVALQYTAAF